MRRLVLLTPQDRRWLVAGLGRMADEQPLHAPERDELAELVARLGGDPDE